MAIAHSRRMHGIMASGEPVIVTALSVEPGNISLATWISAPVDCNTIQNSQCSARFFNTKLCNTGSIQQINSTFILKQ